MLSSLPHVGLRLAKVLWTFAAAVAVFFGSLSGAWSQNPHAGIYLVTFSGPNDNGHAAIMVRTNGNALVSGYDGFEALGFEKDNITVNLNGTFFDGDIDGAGTSVSGSFSAGSVSGSFMESGGAVGSFGGSEEPTTGFLRSAAGRYQGTMSGTVTVNGVPQFSTSGTLSAILAADGSAFGYGVAQGGGFTAEDGGFLTVSPGGNVSGVFLDGTEIDGTANIANKTASGTYSITVFFQGVFAVHSGTWSISRTIGLPNSAPLALGEAFSATAKQTLSVDAATGVLDNDSDPDGDPLTAKLAGGPSNGSLTLKADGGFDYTSDSGFAGMDSFTYRASDGLLDSSPATVTIDVEAPALVAQPWLILLD